MLPSPEEEEEDEDEEVEVEEDETKGSFESGITSAIHGVRTLADGRRKSRHGVRGSSAAGRMNTGEVAATLAATDDSADLDFAGGFARLGSSPLSSSTRV